MTVTVYNAEFFKRGKSWYILFAAFFISIIILSLLIGNFVGVILLFFLLGGYLFFSISNNQHIQLSLSDEGLRIGPKLYPWSELRGFVLEVHPKTQQIHNIVFLTEKNHFIHTFHDKTDIIKDFVFSLSEYLPMLGEYEQTFIERLARRLKL